MSIFIQHWRSYTWTCKRWRGVSKYGRVSWFTSFFFSLFRLFSCIAAVQRTCGNILPISRYFRCRPNLHVRHVVRRYQRTERSICRLWRCGCCRHSCADILIVIYSWPEQYWWSVTSGCMYREWLVMYKLLRIINSVDRIIKSLSYITCVPQFSYSFWKLVYVLLVGRLRVFILHFFSLFVFVFFPFFFFSSKTNVDLG